MSGAELAEYLVAPLAEHDDPGGQVQEVQGGGRTRARHQLQRPGAAALEICDGIHPGGGGEAAAEDVVPQPHR